MSTASEALGVVGWRKSMRPFVLADFMAIKFIISRQGAGADSPPLAEQVFDEPIITIGSDGTATLSLDDPAIASEQAIIINEDGHMLFINRAPGTRLNDEVLAREARRPLADGDTLRLGSYVIRLALNHGARRAPANETRRQTETRDAPAPSARGGEATTDAYASGEQQQQAQQPPATAAPPARNQEAGSFAAILDSLRTEEDSFYFEVVSPAHGLYRVAIENSEMLVGWDATGQNISCHAGSIVAPRAVVRKDWSGVVVQPYGPGMVAVNGEVVEAVRRLRNGDRLTLMPTAVATNPNTNFLVFHEPATLVVLDSLLPQQLPPPVAPVRNAPPASEAGANQDAAGAAGAAGGDAAPRRKLFAANRNYFGYFTLAEVVVMIFGTLVAAVIIFLILEYL